MRPLPNLTSLLGTLLLAGCSSSTPTSTTPSPTLGTLDLLITGLPSGDAANSVSVSGPDFAKSFGASTTLALAPGTYTITAKNVVMAGVTYYPQLQGSPATVKAQSTSAASVLYNPVVVTLSPSTSLVEQGASQTFTAGVVGAANSGVTWTASGGTLSGNGPSVTWTAPSEPGNYTITATSDQETNRYASARVTVPHNKLVWQTQFGSDQWEYTAGVALDAAGNAYLPLGTYGNFKGSVSLVKFDPDGKRLWTTPFGTWSDDKVLGVATTPDGTTYVVGTTLDAFAGQTNAGYYDAYLAKFSADGHLSWAREFGTADFDTATGVAVDASGNVFVSGYRQDASNSGSVPGGQDAYLAKFTADGTLRWKREFGTSAADSATGVAVDGQGGAYVTGNTAGQMTGQSSAGGTDTFVAHYDAAGQPAWMRQFGTAGGENSAGIAVGADGALYVAGNTDPSAEIKPQATIVGAGSALFVAKFTPDGTREWLRRDTEHYGTAVGLTVTSRAVYLAVNAGGGVSRDALLDRLDIATGTWSSRTLGTNLDDFASGVAADASGNVWLSGRTKGKLGAHSNQEQDDGMLAKYGP